jgi:hypothetical protein
MAKQPANNNYNYSIKLMQFGKVLLDQTLQIPVANAKALPGKDKLDAAGLEEEVARIMYGVERAINSGEHLSMGMRCHIEQLPPDVPASMKIDE